MGVAGWVEGGADGTGFSRLGVPEARAAPGPRLQPDCGAQRRRAWVGRGGQAGH